LEIIEDLNWVPAEKLLNISKESKEILAIFTSIGKKLRP
jgi:hypothetical protein